MTNKDREQLSGLEDDIKIMGQILTQINRHDNVTAVEADNLAIASDHLEDARRWLKLARENKPQD